MITNPNIRNFKQPYFDGCSCNDKPKVNGFLDDLGNLFTRASSGEPLATAAVSLTMPTIIGLSVAVIAAGIIIKKA
jgi:hypothetical protein